MGSAFQKLLDIVTEQGGDADLLRNPQRYPAASHIVDVPALQDGFIAAMDSYEIGMTAVELGAGRIRKEDYHRSCGRHRVSTQGQDNPLGVVKTIARIHTNNKDIIDASVSRLQAAIQITDNQPKSADHDYPQG